MVPSVRTSTANRKETLLPRSDGYDEIGDYGAIGNGHAVALVSRSGSIDWWCPLRFDHPSVFAALLDRERGGRFRIAPAGRFDATRRYLDGTNVLETTFSAAGGSARLLDVVPFPDPGSGPALQPPHAILRRIEGLAGEVELRVEHAPRFDYGRARPRMEARGDGSWVASHGADALALAADSAVALEPAEAGVAGAATVREGDRFAVSLTFARQEPLPLPPVGSLADREIERTIEWWRRWSSRTRYDGPFAAAVERSALALKLLTFSPSGAIVAAATTSLPENVGGSRNWDYRYCWLRDATLTLRVLSDLGHTDEGHAFLAWLLHATRLTWPELDVAYDVYGRAPAEESTLDHLEGYRGSRPVRVGNAAAGQFQLDLYGEVIGAARAYVADGMELDEAHRETLAMLGETVRARWRDPDQGIWETRAEARHHVHSKAMCWSALEDLLCLHQAVGLDDLDREAVERERDAIREAVESRGWSDAMGSYRTAYGVEAVDASLLVLGLRGFHPPGHERMRGTLDAVRERLGVNGLLKRYADDFDDGFDEPEGAFGVCSFWAAEILAARGDVADARAEFETVLARANDLGLFAEEIDPSTGAALGNFPQAFTHLGLVSAAMAIRDAEEGG